MPLDKVGDATAQADSLFMTKQSLVLLRNPKIKAKPVLPVTAPTPEPAANPTHDPRSSARHSGTEQRRAFIGWSLAATTLNTKVLQ